MHSVRDLSTWGCVKGCIFSAIIEQSVIQVGRFRRGDGADDDLNDDDEFDDCNVDDDDDDDIHTYVTKST